MGSRSKPFYALALSLMIEGTNKRPKILPAGDLYELRPDGKAVPLDPKNNQDFKKQQEYGRIQIIDGVKRMVRHVIFRLDTDIDALKTYFSTNEDSKRFSAPKRQSMGPVSEDLKHFNVATLKQAVKDGSEKLVRNKATKSKATTAANASIAKLFSKQQNAEVPKKSALNTGGCVDTSSPHALTGLPSSKNESEGEGESSHLVKEDLRDDNHDIGNGGTAAQLSEYIKSVSEKATQTDGVHCADLNHLRTQFELDEALTKYEAALLKIQSMRNERGTDEEMNDILKKIDVKLDTIINSASAGSQQQQGKESQLANLGNLVAGDKEVVKSSQIKFDDDGYISKSKVLAIQERTTKLRPRCEALVDLLCDGDPRIYGISGFTTSGAALVKFTQNMQESVKKILDAMSWDKVPNLELSTVKHRISTYLCGLRSAAHNEKVDPTFSSKKRGKNKGEKPDVKRMKALDNVENGINKEGGGGSSDEAESIDTDVMNVSSGSIQL